MKSYLQTGLFVILISIAINTYVSATDPGAIITVGSEALEEGISVTLPNIILSKIINTTIPEISGSTRKFLVMDITYNITDIHIEDFSAGTVSLYSVKEGYKLIISGINCSLSFDWEYTEQSFIIIKVSDQGTGEMSFQDGTYELEFQIKSKNNKPQFNLKDNKLKLGDFTLSLDGGADWLYDLFNFVIAPVVKRQIESTVEDIVKESFNEINDAIRGIPLFFPIGEGIVFNWGMTDDYQTHDNGFGSYESAAYFASRQQPEAVPPFDVDKIPNRINYDMAQVIISEYTFNTLGWALFEAGSLNATVPLGTTNEWRLLIPSLYRAYPDAPVEMDVASLIYPVFSLNRTGLLLRMAPYTYWNVMVNDTKVHAFTILIELSVSVELFFDNSTSLLHGKVGVPTFDLTLMESDIGSFSLLQLEIAVESLIDIAILPAINSVFSKGIPIPAIFGLTLKDPTIGFEDGYLYMTSGIGRATKEDPPAAVYTVIPQQWFPF